MKKSLIVLMVLSLLLCGCGKEEISDTTPTVEVEETQGEVIQDVTGPEAETDPEDVTEPVDMETVYRLVRTSVFNDKGQETLYREYVYDAYGRQTEFWEYSDGEVLSFSITTWISDTEAEITYSYYEEGTLIHMIYDEDGNPILNERIEQGTVTSKTTHAYDEYGSTVSTYSVFGDTATEYTYEFTYNDQGKPLVRKEFINGELSGWLEVVYDSQDRESTSVYYYPDGSVNYTTVTSYEDGAVRTSYLDPEGNCHLTQITVTDDHGNLLSRETWQGNEMVSRTENTYEETQIIAE